MAALLLLLVGMWSVWAFVESPLLAGVSQDRARIAQDRALIRQSGQDRQHLSDPRRLGGQWDTFIAAAAWRLDHTSPELIGAELQRRVQGFASQAGARVISSRALPVQLGALGDTIGLEFEVESSAAGLRGLLFSIEAARPRIFVDRLAVRVPESGTADQNDMAVTLHLTICALPHQPGAI